MVWMKSSTTIGKLIFVVSPLKNNICGQSGSLSLNGGIILPTILNLKWLHMKQFMVTHLQYSFHTPPTVHQFRSLAWFFKSDIKFFTFCRTIFTWPEPAWNTKPINTVLSALFKSMTWFFFVSSLISNPPWNSMRIKCSLQISLVHIQFFRRLGLLLINWHLLLLAFSKWLAPTPEHKYDEICRADQPKPRLQSSLHI